MPRKRQKQDRSATSSANRDLQQVTRQLTQSVKNSKTRLGWAERRLRDAEKALTAAKKELTRREKKLENTKELIKKKAANITLKKGQAVHHKQHGTCLVRDFRVTRNGRSIRVVLTGSQGGTYEVPVSQCIPFEDMTTAIFG